MNRLTFLGTGTSSGVPVIGCNCEVCRSGDPRDRRLRTSAYVETGGSKILIDAGPDLREQFLRRDIRRVDALLVTHSHYDHIGGADDLRQINFIMRKPVPVYGNALTVAEIRERFGYIFRKSQTGGGKPRLELHTVEAGVPFEVSEANGANGANAVSVTPVAVVHGEIPILGYVIGSLCYITDASKIPEPSYEQISRLGVKLLVLNALRYEPHPTHFSIAESLEAVRRIGPERAYLIHFTHNVKHSVIEKELPPNVFPAFDGLSVEF